MVSSHVSLMAWRKRLKRIFFIFLSSYFFIFVIYLVKDAFHINRYENCEIQNYTSQIEKSFKQYIDAKLETYFKSIDLVEDIKLNEKWINPAANLYVYSAYLEICPSVLNVTSAYCVKFIAIVLSNSTSLFKSKIKCGFNNSMIIFNETFAIIELLPESHFKSFTAAYAYCPLGSNKVPTHASLYETSVNIKWIIIQNYNVFLKSYFNELNSLKIVQVSHITPRINVCVRPMFNTFSAADLSEFLVYYSIMGIDHFIFYYMKSFELVVTFVNFLKFSNVSSEIHFWNIPFDNDMIHEYGQIAFIQDCIARSKKKFTHTIIVDFDEYIVPKIQKNMQHLVSYLDSQNKNAGSYVIPMAMFCDEFSFDDFPNFPFRILNHKKRQKTSWQHHYRSKVIIKPDRVRYCGIHFVWKHLGNYEEILLSPTLAVVNHYRTCCGMEQTWFSHLLSFKVLNDEIIIDDTLASHEAEFLNHDLIQFILNLISPKI